MCCLGISVFLYARVDSTLWWLRKELLLESGNKFLSGFSVQSRNSWSKFVQSLSCPVARKTQPSFPQPHPKINSAHRLYFLHVAIVPTTLFSLLFSFPSFISFYFLQNNLKRKEGQAKSRGVDGEYDTQSTGSPPTHPKPSGCTNITQGHMPRPYVLALVLVFCLAVDPVHERAIPTAKNATIAILKNKKDEDWLEKKRGLLLGISVRHFLLHG